MKEIALSIKKGSFGMDEFNAVMEKGRHADGYKKTWKVMALVRG